MRRPLLLFFACLWSCAAAISAPGADPFRRDGIVAVVGETPITRTAAFDLARGELDRLREQASGEEFAGKAQALLAAAAETLIRSELLLLEGKRLVDASEVLLKEVRRQIDLEMRKRARRLGGEARFREELRREGVTYAEVRRQMEEGLLRELVIYRTVRRDLRVSPEAVREYYENHPREFITEASLDYRQILLKDARTGSRERSLETARTLEKSPTAGAAFADLARKHSHGERADKGGLWPAGEWSEVDPAIRERILSLKEGEHTAPIEGLSGVYLFYGQKVVSGGRQTFAEVQERIRSRLERKLMLEREEKLFGQLEKRYYVRRFDAR